MSQVSVAGLLSGHELTSIKFTVSDTTISLSEAKIAKADGSDLSGKTLVASGSDGELTIKADMIGKYVYVEVVATRTNYVTTDGSWEARLSGVTDDVAIGGYEWQIRTELEFEAYLNAGYVFTVVDEKGNEVSATCTVTDISRQGAEISYMIESASVYEGAKIVFSASEDVKLISALEDGFSVDGTKRYDSSYNREIVVYVSGDAVTDGAISGVTFVFENLIGIRTSVTVSGELDAVDRKIVTVSSPGATIASAYGGEITLSRANSLVARMKGAKKAESGRLESYYGLNFNTASAVVSEESHLEAVSTLGLASVVQVVGAGGVVSELEAGDIEIVTAAQKSGYEGYSNGNITGVRIGENLVYGDGSETSVGESFHVSIVNR